MGFLLSVPGKEKPQAGFLPLGMMKAWSFQAVRLVA